MGSELFLSPEFFKKSASCKLIQEMANKNGIEKINLTPFFKKGKSEGLNLNIRSYKPHSTT
jgi:hypothetical protein